MSEKSENSGSGAVSSHKDVPDDVSSSSARSFWENLPDPNEDAETVLEAQKLWQCRISKGSLTSSRVVGQTLVVAGWTNVKGDDLAICAMDLLTGKTLWNRRYLACRSYEDPVLASYASMVITRQRTSPDGTSTRLVFHDIQTGAEVLEILLDHCDPVWMDEYQSTLLILDGNRLLEIPAHSPEVITRCHLRGEGSSVAVMHQNILYAVTNDGIFGYDPNTGAPTWHFSGRLGGGGLQGWEEYLLLYSSSHLYGIFRETKGVRYWLSWDEGKRAASRVPAIAMNRLVWGQERSFMIYDLETGAGLLQFSGSSTVLPVGNGFLQADHGKVSYLDMITGVRATTDELYPHTWDILHCPVTVGNIGVLVARFGISVFRLGG